MTPPFFFNKPFRLSAAEKTLFFACADKATVLHDIRPVEPWMVGLKNRLPGKGVSATLLDRGTSRKWQDVPRGVAFAEVAPPSRTRKRGSRSR